MIYIINLNQEEVEQKYLEVGASINSTRKYFKVSAEKIKKMLENSDNMLVSEKLNSKGQYKYIVDGDIVTLYFTKRNGEVIISTIDLEDLEKFLNYPYHWYIAWHKNTKSYYLRCTVYLGKDDNGKFKNKLFYLHKYLMNAEKKEYVDHEDHNTLNNCKSNLRLSINKDNTKNRKGKNSNNKSGYRNVCKIDNKWIVQLQIDGQNVILNRFPLDQLEEAGAYAKEMRRILYGEFAGNS